MASNTVEVFAEYMKYLDTDQQLRESLRSQVQVIEEIARKIQNILGNIHQASDREKITKVCSEATSHFPSVQNEIQKLKEMLLGREYYRFHDLWRFVMQRLSSQVVLIAYLMQDQVIPLEEVATKLGLNGDSKEGFHLDLEDYLHGVLLMTIELSRFAINAVTAGDYERPRKIASMLSELQASFGLLNLKNDSLRKRFDGLKYNVKRVEEVVYDLSIRGLLPPRAKAT
ncbi:unnamed protein product [Darwinula stevensoni]|uniref:Translin n=1 Tax=Darwinula stevensoni TaxID=69355 RepID=A0A7R8XM76_9CRUS|nr:unnamed protein product [Darwinula stevensoni]CAG0895245.1 unnamed protein product [Darwinula stevensoni]